MGPKKTADKAGPKAVSKAGPKKPIAVLSNPWYGSEKRDVVFVLQPPTKNKQNPKPKNL